MKIIIKRLYGIAWFSMGVTSSLGKFPVDSDVTVARQWNGYFNWTIGDESWCRTFVITSWGGGFQDHFDFRNRMRNN